MGDLISRKEVIDILCKLHIDNIAVNDKRVTEFVREIPSIDAVPVVHGEWIEHKCAEEVGAWLISNFECSQCHMWNRNKRDFCPECGADMRKKVSDGSIKTYSKEV